MKKTKIALTIILGIIALHSQPLVSETINYKCYDSWDDPSIWRDDYNARRCTPCDYIRGHDFGDESFCTPTPV